MKRRIFISLLWLLFSTITNVEAAASSSTSVLQDPIASPEAIQVLRLGSNPILPPVSGYPADASYSACLDGTYLAQLKRLNFYCLHITKNKQYADDFSIPTDEVYTSGRMRIFYTDFNAPDFDKKVLGKNKLPFDLIITDRLTSKFIDEKSFDEGYPSSPKSIERFINLLKPGGFLILTDTSETYDDGQGTQFPKKNVALYWYDTHFKEFDRADNEWKKIEEKSSITEFEKSKKEFLEKFSHVFSNVEKGSNYTFNIEFAKNIFQVFKRCLKECTDLSYQYSHLLIQTIEVFDGTHFVEEKQIGDILKEYTDLTSGQDAIQKFFNNIDWKDADKVFSFVYDKVPNSCSKVLPFELSLIDPITGQDRTQINGGPKIKITSFKDAGDFFIFVQKSPEILENLREIIWYLFTLGNNVDGKKVEDTVKKYTNPQGNPSMKDLIDYLAANRQFYKGSPLPEHKEISFPASIIVVQRLS